MITQSFNLLKLAIFALLLQACGGSDGGGGNDTPPILVNAGPNITLNETETADIAGGSSGGTGAITYAWQGATNVLIAHSDVSVTRATITAPVVTQTTEFTINLLATDEAGTQQSDSFTLIVNPVNVAPTAIITSNQVTGYAAQTYPVTSTIMLSGVNSSDSDPQSIDPPISSYLWQQIAGPSMLAGIDSSQVAITLIAPTLDSDQSAVFRLTVVDQEQASHSQDISLMLLAQSKTLPNVQVDTIREVFAGEILSLRGSAQSLAPDAAPFSPTWRNNNTAIINNATAFSTYAIAPLVAEQTEITYVLSIEDSFRNEESAQGVARVYAPTVRIINDTGVTLFANNESVVTSYQHDFAGQDADFGADRQTLSGQVIKVGDGEAGFDFTRLDSNGDAVDNPSFAFNCIRDNVTGLVWQVKDNVNNTSLEYVDQSFTWFSEDENGNFEGALNENANTCNVANGQCNTQDYIAQINTQGMCGFFDWRLPKVNELLSIVHYGKTTPPRVDTVFLPYWGSNDSQALWYWTQQSSADGVNNDTARNAWAVDMNTGNDGFLSKTTAQRVMLVRAGR